MKKGFPIKDKGSERINLEKGSERIRLERTKSVGRVN